MKSSTLPKFIIEFLAGIFAFSFYIEVRAAQESPQQFAFEGRLYQPDGTTPLGDVVNFKFQILNPNASGNPVNDCVLYEEVQNGVNLGATSGVFTLSIGSGTGGTKRTGSDAGLTLAQIFDNSKVITAPAGQCPAGSYTPSAGSVRRLRVTVTNTSNGSTETLSPDMMIGSVPQAVVAETLQGLGPTEFLKIDGTTAMTEALTFDNWTSSGRPTSPVVGSTGFNTTTGYLESWNGSAWVDYSAGSGGGSLSGLTAGRVPFATSGTAVGDDSNLFWDNTNKRLGIGTSSPSQKLTVSGNALLTSSGGASNPALSVDASAFGAATANGAFLTDSVSGDTVIANSNAGANILFGIAGGNSKMKITAAGNVGIGTTTPSSPLEVTSATATYSINGNNSKAGGGYGVYGNASGATGVNVGVYGYSASSNAQAIGVWGRSNAGYGVLGQSNSGNSGLFASNSSGNTAATLVTQQNGTSTANLFESQNGAGTTLSYINSSGFFYQPGAPTGATLQAATTSYVDSAVTGATGAAVTKDGLTPLTGDWDVSGGGSRSLKNIAKIAVGSSTLPTGGVAHFNGNVGIGTSTPGSPLEVNGNALVNGYLTVGGTGYMYFTGNSNKEITVNDSGSSARLAIKGGGHASSSLTLQSTFGVGTTDYINFLVGNNGATETMRLTNNGRVGIGNANPQAKLEVAAGVTTGVALFSRNYSTLDPAVQIRDLSGADRAIIGFNTYGANEWAMGSTGASGFSISSGRALNDTTIFNLLPAGNMGLGIASPQTRLDISGTDTDGTFRVYDQTAATGVTREIVREGAGQGTTKLTEWQNNAGTVVASVDKTGRFVGDGSGLTGISGSISGLTAGRVPFASSSSGISDDSNLVWDNTNKRLGIGTASPASKLHIEGSGAAVTSNGSSILVGNTSLANDTGGRHTLVYASSANDGITGLSTGDFGISARITQKLHLGTGTSGQPTSRLTIDQNGNVGIGTISPTSRLHGSTTLGAATGNEVAYQLNYATDKATSGNDTGLLINMTDTASPATSLLIDAQVGGSSVFYVSNNGMGFFSGSLSVQSTLFATGLRMSTSTEASIQQTGTNAGSALRIDGGAAASSYLSLRSTTATGTTDHIKFQVGNAGGTEAMRIISSGNVGIGTTTPSQKLDVNGAIGLNSRILFSGATSFSNNSTEEFIGSQSSGNLEMAARGSIDFYADTNANDSTTSANFKFFTATPAEGGTAKVVITNAGNVGIGTTSPGALLQLGTAGTSLGTMRLTGSTSGYVQVQPAAAAGSWTMTLPPDAGTSGYVLQTDGAGVTSWVAQSGGGGSSSGTAGHIQYSNGSSGFSSDANKLFWDATNDRLGIGTNTPTKEFQIYGGNPTMAITNSTFTDLRFWADSAGGTIDAGGGELMLRAGSSPGAPTPMRMRLASTGQASLGTIGSFDAAAPVSGINLLLFNTATSGTQTTKQVIQAGNSQAGTNMFETRAYNATAGSGTLLSYINSSGYFYQPGTPTAATDQAATTNYVDSAITTAAGSELKKDGTVALTGTWGVGNQAINNISTLSVGTATAPTGGVATFNGNVGVGTTTPAEKLTVNGNVIINNSTNPQGANLHVSGTIFNESANATFNSTAAGAVQGVMRLSNYSSTVGSGASLSITAYDSAFAVRDYAQIGGFSTTNTSGSHVGAMTFSTATAGALSEKMRILGTGNVGIGTTAPQQKLEVVGKIHIDDTSNNSIVFEETGDDTYIGHPANNNISLTLGGTERVRFLTSGVGMGTSTPAADLHVRSSTGGYTGLMIDTAGTLAASGAVLSLISKGDGSNGLVGTNKGWSLHAKGDGYSPVSEANDLTLSYYNGATWVSPISVDALTGGVGIGTNSPASRLHIGVAPTASANYGLFSLGSGPFDGSTAGFFTGHASGTIVAGNAASGYAGDLINMQIAGVQKFKVDKDGKVYGDGSGLSGVTASAAGSSGQIQFNNGSNAMAADSTLNWDNSAKRLGLNTASPGALLDVNGISYLRGNVYLNNIAAYTGNDIAFGNTGKTTFSSNVGIGAATPTAGLHNSKAGAASTPAERIDGAWFTGGTSTTTKPQVLIEPASTTSTGWSTAGTGLGINAASGFTGKLIDAQINGSTIFEVKADGTVGSTAGFATGNLGYTIGGNVVMQQGGSGVLNLLDGPTTGFSRINMGPATSSFPALAVSGSDLKVIRADNSTNANLLVTGNVGIGTTNPVEIVDISKNQNAGTKLRISNTDAGGGAFAETLYVSNAGSFSVGAESLASLGGAAYLWNSANTGLIFATNSSERMRISNSGNVGIGATSPGALLQIGTAGTSLGTLRLTGNTSGYVQIQPAAAAGSYNFTLPPNGGTNGFVLQTDGSGTTSWVAQSGGGGSGVTAGITTKTANYTATGTDHTILVSASGGAVTITIPAASSHSGRIYVIKKTDSSGNNVTLSRSGSDTIDGATSQILTNQYESYTIQSDGTNWWIL